jgi:hypothetical protein
MYKPLPDELSLDKCILNPYPNIKPNQKIYNCQKVLASPERDDSNQIDIIRNFYNTPQKERKHEHITCFEEVGKFANPLEVCNSPLSMFPLLGLKSTTKSLPLGILAFNQPDSKNPRIPIDESPLCEIAKMKPGGGDPTKEQYEKDNELFQSFEYEYQGTKYTVWRHSGFIMRTLQRDGAILPPSLKTHKIPLFGSSEDKLGRPYAYIHPKLMRPFKNRTEYSYGYYDCFGKPLMKFDDCGNLGFTLVDSSGKEKEAVQELVKGKYNCFQSQIPDYECGVPKVLTDEACRLWKGYYGQSITTTYNITTT